MTWALPEQSFKVTEVGVTENGPIGVGQLPAPVPVALIVTDVLEEPSETVTVAPENDDDGLARRTERMLPETVADTLPLFEEAE